MNKLSKELDRYLMIRRSFGSNLGTTARVLQRFIDFAEQQDADHISTDLFLRWQKVFGKAHRQTWAARLGMVRLFAQWLQVLDPRALFPAVFAVQNPISTASKRSKRLSKKRPDFPP